MPKFSKKIIIIIASAVLAIIIIAVTIILLVKITPSSIEVKQQADSAKMQAIEAIKNKDNAKAKTLLEQAKRQYDDLNKTGVENNDQVDVNALLGLVESDASTTPTTNN